MRERNDGSKHWVSKGQCFKVSMGFKSLIYHLDHPFRSALHRGKNGEDIPEECFTHSSDYDYLTGYEM